MSPTASKALRVGISLGLAIGLLLLFLRNVDLPAVGRAFRNARIGWLSTALVLALVAIPTRAWRWIRLLRRIGPVTMSDSVAATCIGFAASTLLPARAGEVVRPAVLARASRLPFPPLLASIGLERLVDLVAVLALFVFYALGGWVPAQLAHAEAARLLLLRRSALFLGAATVAGLAFVGLLAARPGLSDRALALPLRLLPERWRGKVARVVNAFLAGLGSVRTPAEIAIVTSSSFALWLVNSLQVYATMRAFDIDFPVPVSFFVITWAVIGLAIPTPGGVGGYHAAIAYSLTGFYAVDPSTAAAFALASHAISFIPVTVLGLMFLGGGGLKLGRLTAEAQAQAASGLPADASGR